MVKKEATESPKDDYIAKNGTLWKFVAQLDNDERIREFCQQNNFVNYGQSPNRRFFICRYDRYANTSRSFCQSRGIYNEQNGVFYINQKHGHIRHHPLGK